MFRRFKVRPHERGLLFREGDFVAVLRPGVRWMFDPLLKLRLDVVSTREPWLHHADLDLIVRSGLVGSEAIVLDLVDTERALVWIDNRFDRTLTPGRYAIWTIDAAVRVEIVSTRDVQLVHSDLPAILGARGSAAVLDKVVVEAGHEAVVFRDGAHVATLGAGTYSFWRDVARIRAVDVDLKEQSLDIAGQEIMTADKVTLRLNALVTFRIVDPLKSVMETDGVVQALYRASQLALREIVGAKELDALLTSRDALGRELEELTRVRAAALGIEVASAGVRDVILPGDMKELLNRVTEARKAAEAALITRREETAAMRMQANTAKILESSPTLMKLRELEVLEKVADKANLTVVLGDSGGLSDRVVKLL
jgi:regulator of protease activity HflC (stomatin/prohibitin superfamily)